MGYTSDVVIGVTKELRDKSIAQGNLPVFFELAGSRSETKESVYWSFSGIKWYESIDEILEIIRWLEWCEDENEHHDEPALGAIRLGENCGDVETWGSPWDFGIEVQQTLVSPAQ